MPTVISWLVVVLALACAWHFIYEAIVLPSLLQHTRFKLFALRDRLRALKAESPVQCADEPFHLLDNSLSWRMDNLPRLTIVYAQRLHRRIERDAALREQLESRARLLESCQLPEFVEIWKESNVLTTHALGINSGGWFIYLLPIAYVMAIWDGIQRLVRSVNVIPEEELTTLQACPA
ncbi:MAG: hypothetical protein HZA93_24160 [Verrucomicrobia bacterium]|nr:hypothetical protein [Verrucomicrobiota bacterium]